MAVRRFVVPVAVDASGDATVYSPYLSGNIESIVYAKTDYANGVDFTITAEGTTETIWTESNVDATAVRRPRAATHSTAGVASVYASGGTAVNGKLSLSRDRVKIVVASGGVSKTGTFHITVSD